MISSISKTERYNNGLSPSRGFSLPELLICLAILGVITAMTIPQLFQTPASNQANRWNSIAKDATLMIITAYEQYKVANASVATTVSGTHLTPYMNYLKLDTSSTIDSSGWSNSMTCSASTPCLVLHNGAKIYLGAEQFAGTTTSNVIQFVIDPDGIYTTSSTSYLSPKSLQVEMYYDGYVKTRDGARNPSCHSAVCGFSGATNKYDPSWFTGF